MLNEIQKKYEKLQTIHHTFENQVLQNPNAIAVACDDKEMRYTELNCKANQLAHYLVEEGIRTDDLVAICVDRSFDMMIGLLAILKAGAAYLPIDPNYPHDRIEFTLNDSKAKIVLTQELIKESLPKIQTKQVCIDTFDLSKYPQSNVENDAKVNDLAYVIYTSGTTGRPKGVMLEHANVDRLFKSTEQYFDFNKNDIWSFFHSFAFDFAVWEIWGALLYGGKVVIVPYSISRSPEEFYKLLIKEKITILNQTPSAFKQLIEVDKYNETKLTSLRSVVFGGEKLEFSSLGPWYEKYDDDMPQLVNMYGITETTVHTTYNALCKNDILNDKSLIGHTLCDLGCYVLDSECEPVPKGEAAELYIIGDGLARGYLNQLQLTNERFMPNPFIPNSKMYKTGDLVRFTEDGNIEYLGRTDDQVQLRGFRIELGEIEQQLLHIDTLKEAIVLLKEDTSGQKILVGYVKTHQKIDIQNIKASLLKNLPEYMIPNTFIQVENMPLTINGKIDKKALLKLDVKYVSSSKYVPPKNKIEESLVSIFSEVLKIEKIGINDDFFELGGNSLLVVGLLSKINKSFNKSLSLTAIFQASNVLKLSTVIEKGSDALDILLPIQIQGKENPIFAVPGIGGTGLEYELLSRTLGKGQPFYVLQSVGFDGKRRFLSTVEAIAKENVKFIKDFQPQGPYRIMGFSFGGTVAFEMARLLGDEVEGLMMLDTFPSTKKNLWGKFLIYIKRIDMIFLLKHYLDKLHNKKKDRSLAMKKVINNNYICGMKYKVKPLKVNIDIALVCTEYRQHSTINTASAWDGLTVTDMSIYKLKGGHIDIIRERGVRELSTLVQEYFTSIKKEEKALLKNP